MKESKLVNILKCFTEDEIRLFEKFILSPYFSSGRNVRGLYNLLRLHHPVFESDELERESIFTALYPGESFNERKLKNLSSSLTHLAEQFLIQNSIESTAIESKLLLAEQYLKRGEDKLFLSTLRSIENNTASGSDIGTEWFDEEKRILKLNEKYNLQKNKFNKSVPFRLKSTEYTTVSFLLLFFKRLKDSIILPVFYNTDFSNPLIDSFRQSVDIDKMITLLEKEKYSLLWLIEIYYYNYKSLLFHKDLESETYYNNTKTLFYENLDKLSRPEKYFMFDSLATYCAMRDPENQMFTRECFEVYDKMLEENAYTATENEPMKSNLYANMMLWALDVCEYDWLEKFIEKYSGKLKADQRENMTYFAKANLSFGRCDYESALVYINKVQNDFLVYKIQVRNLKFKIYYELNLFDLAFSLVDSYRHFLNENTEIHDSFKKRALDFVNIYVKLLKAKATGNVSEIDIIKNKTDNILGYELKPWLMEKIDELIKRGAK